MNKQDLIKMMAAAAQITRAAQAHEDYLRQQVENWETLPDHSDYAVVGESWNPLAQALADWRRLMAAMYPPSAPEAVEDVSAWLSNA